MSFSETHVEHDGIWIISHVVVDVFANGLSINFGMYAERLLKILVRTFEGGATVSCS